MQIAESVFKEKPDKPGMAFAPYDKLPEPFKAYIKKDAEGMRGGFRTSDLDNKALSELTDNKMYAYGTTYFSDSDYYSVWRREIKEGAASSTSGGGYAKKWPTNILQAIAECNATEANKLLEANQNRTATATDPMWRLSATYKMNKRVSAGMGTPDAMVQEEDKLVYVLQLVKKVW